MTRIVLIACIAFVLTASFINADLFWYNSGAITDNGGTALTASDSDATVGCFAQLIKANGSTPNDFVYSGNGVSGGDAVVATMYAGMNDMFFTDGYFPLQSTAAVSGSAGNGYYYVRVFDAAQATVSDWNEGNSAPIPASASYYFQTSIHQYTHNETVPENWDFASSGGSTTVAIPEPTTLAFLGLGIVAFIVRKRVRG